MKKRILPACLSAIVLTVAVSFGFLFANNYALINPLYKADLSLSDAMFQRGEGSISGKVIVIGIDAASLERFGPYPWSRDIIASAIEQLNSDPTNRPAAIGVDVLYTGEGNPDSDEHLAHAASQGNVVVAMSGVYGSTLVTEEDNVFYMRQNVVITYDEPYEMLKQNAHVGHINIMLDRDGIMRHGLLFMDLPNSQRMFSFASVLVDLYSDKTGKHITKPPTNTGFGGFYIPFTASPGAFYLTSILDVLDGKVLDIRDKIVLIGPYASGMQDARVTSIEHGEDMYGVEIHANMIDGMIQNRFKTEVPDWIQTLVVFLLSFVCFLWFWNRRMLPATIGWLVLTGISVGLSLIGYRLGYVSHALWLPLSITVLYVVSVAVNYMRAAMEKRKVTNTFKRYVAPEIVSEILKEGVGALELGGKLCHIAVLFVDIRGFTTLSEQLSPRQVVEILNDYLTLTSTCITKNGGTLDKFVGDATMAFWGAPLEQEDSIFKAVKTALDMIAASAAMEQSLKARYGFTVGFGVGIHYGPAIVGNVGATMRMDYTAIGDTVNTAARLEANAPMGTVYVSRDVADALAGRVKFTSLGDKIKLKGKADGFEILTVDGYADNP
jgi:adenylate cyclase